MNKQFISRRKFLKTVGAGALAIGLASGLSPFRVSGQPKTLKIMQWSHFVPAYDAWFDPFVKKWGQERKPPVEVTVDHISFADIIPRANAEVAAQKGHDLFHFLAPPAAFEPQVIDMKDLVETAEKKHGPYLDLARKSSFNPVTKKFYGFSPVWTIDPGDYRSSIWAKVGMPKGPSTWDELLKGGIEIKKLKDDKGRQLVKIPIGVGYSQDIDSNMATRAIMWSFGASTQDAESNITLNTPETLAALEYGVKLFKEAMAPDILTWNAASNNQALNAGETAYILNSISAYRTAQDLKLPVADDIFFVPALKGPAGQFASEHVMGVYVIWKFAEQQDLAKEFLAFLIDNAREGVLQSKLYDTPSFIGAVADPGTPLEKKVESGLKWLDGLFENDPFGSKPADKLAALKPGEALKWSTNIGHPGPAHPAEGEIFDTFVIPDMFAKAATGRLSPKAALEEADAKVKAIYKKWRERGLVGGGGKDK